MTLYLNIFFFSHSDAARYMQLDNSQVHPTARLPPLIHKVRSLFFDDKVKDLFSVAGIYIYIYIYICKIWLLCRCGLEGELVQLITKKIGQLNINEFLQIINDNCQSFQLPTDAQLNCLKNNFKFYIKIYIKTATTCFGVITINRERTTRCAMWCRAVRCTVRNQTQSLIPNSALHIH